MLFAVFVFTGFVAAVAQADGEILLEEDFEAYDAGSGPADWGGQWLIVTGGEKMTASDAVVHSGQRSFKHDGTGDCRISRIFDEQTEEKVITLEFYVHPNMDTVRAMTFSIFGGDPLNPSFDAGVGNWGPFISCLNVGDFAYYDSKQWNSVAPYKANQWYHIKLVADVDTDTFDFYIDDMDNPVKKGAAFCYEQENLSSLMWHMCDAYFDDALVYEGDKNPEAVDPDQKLAATWGKIKTSLKGR